MPVVFALLPCIQCSKTQLVKLVRTSCRQHHCASYTVPRRTFMSYTTPSAPSLLIVTVLRLVAASMTPPARPSSDTTGLGLTTGTALLAKHLRDRLRGPVSDSRVIDALKSPAAYRICSRRKESVNMGPTCETLLSWMLYLRHMVAG